MTSWPRSYKAASQLVDDRPVAIGSQAILGTYDEDVLPAAATVSMEANVAFLNDADRMKADLVTGAIGEGSNFHQLRYAAECGRAACAASDEGRGEACARVAVLAVVAGRGGRAR